MMTFERSAGLTALVLILAGALTLTGCGGGGDGQAARTGGIAGTIVHAGTGQPLGAITVIAGGVATQTAADGSFRLNNVPAGPQVLTITVDASRGLALPPGVNLAVVVPDGAILNLPAPIQLIDAVDVPPNPPS